MGGPGEGDADAATPSQDSMAASASLDAGLDGATPSSVVSTPDDHDADDATAGQEPAQPPKRKGGRKPIYATSEERKQRNRQAQAAFRERRTEYIKQLEATIKENEASLSSLQQSHRSAADECLMLRYKNSLLERILLEKGIDVQAELQQKSGGPLGLQHPAANMPYIPQSQTPLQRTAVQRQHARRSGHSTGPRVAPGPSNLDMGHQSPQGHPTPSSHTSSPTNNPTRSPIMMYPGGNASPTSAAVSQHHSQQSQFSRVPQQAAGNPMFFQQRSQISPHSHQAHQQPAQTRFPGPGSAMANHNNIGHPLAMGEGNLASTGSAFYPSPFQKHIDQLEQEYDIQEPRSMLDQPDPDDRLSTPASGQLQGIFPAPFDQAGHQQRASNLYSGSAGGAGMPPAPQQQASFEALKFEQGVPPQGLPVSYPPHSGPVSASAAFESMEIDPDDPMLSADPFGLSASMHYPTSYSFEKPPPPRPQQQ